ncbi:uncharacterized protein BYT42DRAFT_550692 [Radiomyces spectabilis]|uniref:uncharacterized protein n=1 Tax=Radiomyces spectabilis TaxID=64574 RepID=UPI002220C66B|nr:uncharacterized protein BYT42DRAFT_550692 [Radiomyces spectabilis]KAI8393335.1 hypothetical protein BYT42DRAFT_550692 [Radiomyces spectabilis]
MRHSVKHDNGAHDPSNGRREAVEANVFDSPTIKQTGDADQDVHPCTWAQQWVPETNMPDDPSTVLQLTKHDAVKALPDNHPTPFGCTNIATGPLVNSVQSSNTPQNAFQGEKEVLKNQNMNHEYDLQESSSDQSSPLHGPSVVQSSSSSFQEQDYVSAVTSKASSPDGDLSTNGYDSDVQTATLVAELKKELEVAKTKCKEAEDKYAMHKAACRKDMNDYHALKDDYVAEVAARSHTHGLMDKLKREFTVLKEQVAAASRKSTVDVGTNTEEDEDAYNLGRICDELRRQRDHLVEEIEDLAKNYQTILDQQEPPNVHWKHLQASYETQMFSLKSEVTELKKTFDQLTKDRDEAISEMIMLNDKNAELTEIINDLSRRVSEREREALALMAGTNFVTNDENLRPNHDHSTQRHRAGSVDMSGPSNTPTTGHRRSVDFGIDTPAAAREPWAAHEAPHKLFSFRKGSMFSKLGSSMTGKHVKKRDDDKLQVPLSPNTNKIAASTSEPLKSSKPTTKDSSSIAHSFLHNKYTKPAKCDHCGEKMRKNTELQCEYCGTVCHTKCVPELQQICLSNSSSESSAKPLLPPKVPIFGNELRKQVQSENGNVPLLVRECVATVEARGMDHEGIYRKSGGAGQIRLLQQRFEQGMVPDLADDEQWNDICAVTSLLKQYFRELPDPLFTYELHPKLMDAMDIGKARERYDRIHELLQQLPPEHYITVRFLIQHLDRVRQRSKENLMTTKNLALVFGPTLMRNSKEKQDLLEMNRKIKAVEYILDHARSLFTESPHVSIQTHAQPARRSDQSDDISTDGSNTLPPRESSLSRSS